MLRTRVMPCLLLQDGRLVKTKKFKSPDYVGDPVNAVKIYNEKEVDELLLLDITATVEGRRPPFDIIEEVASECFMPLTYGGGIRQLEDIRTIFNLGVEKVAINSYAVNHPEFISEAAERFGSQSIVVSIDVRKSLMGKYIVHSHSGTRSTKIDPVTYAVGMEQMGAGEILLNSINRDGLMNGFETSLIRAVTSAVMLPVIAIGGAGSVDDLTEAVKQGGASAVAAGSLFVYQGKNMGVLINFPPHRQLETQLN